MREFFRIAAFVIFMSSVFFSCKSLSPDRLDGEWNVVELQGETVVPTDRTPFLGFDVKESRIYGFTGCNRITGTLDAGQLLKGKPDFSRMGSTRMMCHDDRYETKFLEALSSAEKAECKGQEFVLSDKDGNVLVRLRKR